MCDIASGEAAGSRNAELKGGSAVQNSGPGQGRLVGNARDCVLSEGAGGPLSAAAWVRNSPLPRHRSVSLGRLLRVHVLVWVL